ncbi:MAG: PilZ domain-containing protein [Spirochaetales bacterium]|nr:PilZ domain-containing protein [Leptospiraceae bacterium]MCP5482234.1 PilZ domain-containing protein [Spirochaetales bacterium]
MPFTDRRRRIRRPLSLILVGLLMLALPIINYVNIAFVLHLPLHVYELIFGTLEPYEMVLLLAPIPVGIGLLLVKRWGWWLFLVFSLAMILYNAVVFAVRPAVENLGALILAVIGLVAMAYVLRPDISAPYMKMYPRGWRGQKRKPISARIRVDGQELEALDASVRGVYVRWSGCDREPGEATRVRLRLGEEDFELDAGIVRVDRLGAGLAFRNLDSAVERRLQKALRRAS